MASITYLCRRGARYYYRRRLYQRSVVNHPISISLGTADPVEARRLVPRLSARWEMMAMQMFNRTSRGFLQAQELTRIFRAGLDEELGLAMASHFDAPDALEGNRRTLRVLEAAYRIAARLPADADSVPETIVNELTDGFSDEDRAAVVIMLRSLAPHKSAQRDAESALTAISAPTTPRAIDDARVQLLRARAEAQARAALADHPLAASRGDPYTALLDDDVVAAIRRQPAAHSTGAPAEHADPHRLSGAAPVDSPFLTQDTRRFSEIIEDTIKMIQSAGDWDEDLDQRRRVIRSFGWITGDKRLCDYGPADALHYAQTLRKLPTEFRWGTPEAGAMSRPLKEVLGEVDAMAKKTRRSDRTYNRDLTIMARFSRELAKASWRPRFGKDLIVDFNEHTAKVQDDPTDPDRMPWTEEQLVCAFKAPIYTGGGGCSRRFKTGSDNKVWQDAAYWVPLLLAYTFMSREEACGLECSEIVFDVETPFLIVKANMTKSKNGETAAGLKRRSRHRIIPLHPELLRLGFQKYVTAIEAEGHFMLFPELYRGDLKKRGGTRFYAGAGRYLLDYVDQNVPLLRTSSGKRADLHSMRTAGASFLEDSDAKQVYMDDILGHVREGTGPRKYCKAWFVKGGAAIIQKRLGLMCNATPNLTAHLTPAPLALLPLEERSRTGSYRECASRRKA
ncbi:MULTISPECIES: DUF6538 domain-containing protein [unclassified Sphingomonas]|uniref:DUF6538 domain-containing protein n=1 Tax=unclassified Sphingomonas TaxID=196159 RepID=UPI0028631963|nr:MULTISPECIES: hypothetical protein [unclassified Sphingomonas]MDR6115796.1 integrase [Sphingomonas sp. SORGH_AS_0789]MDR6150533.1 integrase [Sphingomonas sp. SORGH_AS_0742]